MAVFHAGLAPVAGRSQEVCLPKLSVAVNVPTSSSHPALAPGAAS